MENNNQTFIKILCENPDCKELYTYAATKGHKRKVCNQPLCEEWHENRVRKEAAERSDAEAQAIYDISNTYYENLNGPELKADFLGNLYEEIKINRMYVPRNMRRAFSEKQFNYQCDKQGKCIPGLAQAFYMFCIENRGNTPMQIFKHGKGNEAETITNEIKQRELSFTVEIEVDDKIVVEERSYNSAAYVADHDFVGTVEAMTGGLINLSAIKAEKIEKAKAKAKKNAKEVSAKVSTRKTPKGGFFDLFE